MLFQKLAFFAALTAFVAAQEIEQSDIPRQCTQVCAEVVSIARDCDNRFDDNAETQCICDAANANTLLPACDACVQQYDTDSDLDDDDDDDLNDPNDNDVREVMRRCNFAVQSGTASANGGVGAPTASATSFINAASRTSAASTSGANLASSVAAALSQATQNAAPAMTAAAGMGLGALGVAIGML